MVYHKSARTVPWYSENRKSILANGLKIFQSFNKHIGGIRNVGNKEHPLVSYKHKIVMIDFFHGHISNNPFRENNKGNIKTEGRRVTCEIIKILHKG